MKDEGLRPWLAVIAGGTSLVSHAGAALLVETARRSGLARELSARLARWRKPLATHDPGKIVGDLAIAVALGGDAAADVAASPAQPAAFGPVASDPTASRLIAALAQDAEDALAAISGARATARERVWYWARRHLERTGGDPSGRHHSDRALNWHWHRFSISGRAVSGQDVCSWRVATFKV